VVRAHRHFLEGRTGVIVLGEFVDDTGEDADKGSAFGVSRPGRGPWDDGGVIDFSGRWTVALEMS